MSIWGWVFFSPKICSIAASKHNSKAEKWEENYSLSGWMGSDFKDPTGILVQLLLPSLNSTELKIQSCSSCLLGQGQGRAELYRIEQPSRTGTRIGVQSPSLGCSKTSGWGTWGRGSVMNVVLNDPLINPLIFLGVHKMGVIILLFSHPLFAHFSHISSSFHSPVPCWAPAEAEGLIHHRDVHNKQRYYTGII